METAGHLQGRSEEAGRQPALSPISFSTAVPSSLGSCPLHSWFLKPLQASPQVFWPSCSPCLQDFPEAATEDHTFCRHPLLLETFPDHIVYIVPTQARPSLPSPVFISPLHLTADRHCVHLPIGPEWGLHEGRPGLLSADPLILYLCLAHSQVSHGCLQGRIGLLALKHIVTPLESTFLTLFAGSAIQGTSQPIPISEGSGGWSGCTSGPPSWSWLTCQMPSSGRGGELPFQTQHTPLVTVLFMGQYLASYKHRLGAGFQEPWASSPLVSGIPCPSNLPVHAITSQHLGTTGIHPDGAWALLVLPATPFKGSAWALSGFSWDSCVVPTKKNHHLQIWFKWQLFHRSSGRANCGTYFYYNYSFSRLTKLASFKHRYLVQSV